MATPPEKSGDESGQPGFFGMPRGARIWAEAGRRFWGGVVLGIALGLAFGLLIGAHLAFEEYVTPENDTRLAGIGIVLTFLGLMFGQWMIGRTGGTKSGPR
jgi:hypothetical protein